MGIFKFGCQNCAEIKTNFSRKRNGLRTQRGRLQVIFSKNKPSSIFSDFNFLDRREELEKVSQVFFQVAVHFHPANA